MSTMTITGWKHSKGEMDNRPYNFVTIYGTAKMEQNDIQRGSAGVDLRGEPELVDQLKKINFADPVLCDVEIEQRAKGKGVVVQTVVRVEPVVAQVKKPAGVI